MITSEDKTGFFYSEMGKPKVPTIIYEGGEALRSDEYVIKLGVRGIVKVMRELGMVRIKSKVPEASGTPFIAKNMFWIRSPLSGLFRFVKKVGKMTKEG